MTQNYTIKYQIEQIKSELKPLYPLEEITAFIKIIFEKIMGYSFSSLQLHLDDLTDKDCYCKISKIVHELKNYKPIQYIFGETEFFGLPFKVNENVLIPRPETEELVNIIIEENRNQSQINILDIGTGSGCIAVSLAKKLKKALVYAIDVSSEAVELAKENALINDVKIDFLVCDIFKTEQIQNKKFDIIVSNPPYVLEKDKEILLSNVVAFEPHLALFVSNENPLVFYEQIALFARNNLNVNGHLYFEINELFGHEIAHLLHYYNYSNINILKDLNNKDRMIKAQL